VLVAITLAALPVQSGGDALLPGRARGLADAGAGRRVSRSGLAVRGGAPGDALFHLARVRKLADFDHLSLDAVAEFADGGPHPGYAFPLWHGFLALVSRLAASTG
jgi:hypothetical protein